MYFHNTVLKIKFRKRTIGWKDFKLYGFKLRYVDIINMYTVDIIKIIKSFFAIKSE